MEKLRVGVIGLGMGRYHVHGYKGCPDAEVVAVCDINESLLHQIADEYGISNRYQNAEEMLSKESLDIVSIATPNKYHCPLTIKAFESGCHVLCEKPMALSSEEGEKMLKASEKGGKRLMINFSYRFTEQSMALKRQVDRGILGEIYFTRTVWHRRRGLPKMGGWFGQKELSGGGPLIDLGVHRLDLALWLMGYPKPVWVAGSTYDHLAKEIADGLNLAYNVEDFAAGFVRFNNEATMVIEASWTAHIAEKELMETRILGTRGGLVQRNVNEGYTFEAKIFFESEGAHYDQKLHSPLEPVQTPMAHFVDCILQDKPHIATGEEGLRVMNILDALYQSAEKGAPVTLVP